MIYTVTRRDEKFCGRVRHENGGDGRVVGPDQGGEDLPGKFGESEDVVRAHLLHDDSRENVSH